MIFGVNTELYYRLSETLKRQGVPGTAIMHTYAFNFQHDRLVRAAFLLIREGRVIVAWEDDRPRFILKPKNFNQLYGKGETENKV